jgi:hypothetical protein
MAIKGLWENPPIFQNYNMNQEVGSIKKKEA